MSSAHAGHTRHKEYSLAVAVAVAAILYWAGHAGGDAGAAGGAGSVGAGATGALGVLAALNALALFSILYSAFSVVRHADVLAHRFGEPFGSLILSLSIVVLEVSLISILMLSGSAGETLMRDTIYSVIIIVMSGFIGVALLLGGKRYTDQSFNFTGIKHFLISIIPLALMVLALPTALGTSRLGPGQLLVVSVACLLVYVYFLRIQTVTHRCFFVYEDEDSDGHHAVPSARSSAWHFLLLAVHLVAVIGVTKLSSGPLKGLMSALGAPQAFTGFLVALLILSPEGAGAFNSILQNQVQRAMNLLLGSVLATISLTVPVVAAIASLTGQSLLLGLDLPSILLLVATFMVCQTSLTGGSTNAHSGAAHVALFMVYVMLLFS